MVTVGVLYSRHACVRGKETVQPGYFAQWRDGWHSECVISEGKPYANVLCLSRGPGSILVLEMRGSLLGGSEEEVGC